MLPSKWLTEAAQRLDGKINRTPLTYDAARGFYIKWENRQKTGSFKARGALNKVLVLEDWEREMGIVTASAGNHGQGVALAAKMLGAQVKVFVPAEAPAVKVDAIRALGAEIEAIPGGYAKAEEAALFYAKRNDATWISPYNDGHVIAGQGTVAQEILEDLSASTKMTWFVPVSGGGLLAGISSVLRQQTQFQGRIVGVQVENQAYMHGLFYRQTQADVPDLPTLADGLAGAVEDGSITVPLIRKNVDEILLVSEDDVAHAVAFAWQEYGECIEAAGAVGLAALLSGKAAAQPAVIVVSGGNIQPEIHAEILARYEK